MAPARNQREKYQRNKPARKTSEEKSRTPNFSFTTPGLVALAEEISLKRRIIVANERVKRTILGTIEIIPIEEFLKEVWDGGIV